MGIGELIQRVNPHGLPLNPKRSLPLVAPDPEIWREHLPLEIDLYDKPLRLDVISALAEVFSQPPQGVAEIKSLPNQTVTQKILPAALPKVLGLCGKPQSGKDVVAEYLLKHYQKVNIFAFSDDIRDEVNEYLAHYPYRLEGQELVHYITPINKSQFHYRHLLQTWGNARRVGDSTYWARRVQDRANELLSEGARLVVVTGVRTPSEVQTIEEIGGKIIRVIRPGNKYRADNSAEEALDYLSDEHFVTIYNAVEGDILAYEENIEAILHGKTQPHLPR